MGEIVRDVCVAALCAVGILFFVGGTVGLLRCPDLYARLHPSTKCDTLGACSVTLALMIHSGFNLNSLKLIAVIFFVMLSSATCGHAIGRSAFRSRIMPWHEPGVEPWPPEDGR